MTLPNPHIPFKRASQAADVTDQPKTRAYKILKLYFIHLTYEQENIYVILHSLSSLYQDLLVGPNTWYVKHKIYEDDLT